MERESIRELRELPFQVPGFPDHCHPGGQLVLLERLESPDTAFSTCKSYERYRSERQEESPEGMKE